MFIQTRTVLIYYDFWFILLLIFASEPIRTNQILGNDLIAQAQSGTGKTATFTIGVLQQLDLTQKDCQALILAPTRELAQQIQRVVLAIGDYLGVKCHACIGGTRVRDDISTLQNGAHVVVGT